MTSISENLAQIAPSYLKPIQIPFERGIARHLAEQFPEYSRRLMDMADGRFCGKN